MEKSFGNFEDVPFFRFSNDLLAVVNNAGEFINLNTAWEKILGYEEEGLIGERFINLVHSNDKEYTLAQINNLTKEKNIAEYENQVRNKSGSFVWVKWQMIFEQDISYLIGRDISEQEQIRFELEESATRFQSISENLPGLIFQFYSNADGETGLNYISKNSLSLLQLATDDLNTYLERFKSCIPEPDLKRYISSINKAIRNKTNWEWEGNFILSDGTRKFLKGSSIVRRTGEGLLFDGLLFDITDEQRVKEALYKNEGILRSTLESVEDAILIVDKNRVITHYNANYKNLFSFAKDVLSETEHKPYIDSAQNTLINPDGFIERISEIYSSKENSKDILNFKDGRIIERLSFPLYIKENFGGRVWTFRDITFQEKEKEKLELFKKSIDNSTDAVYWLTEEGNFIYVNEIACKNLGYQRDELCSLSIIDIDPDLTQDKYKSFWDDCQNYKEKGNVSQYFDSLHQRKDGSVYPVNVSVHHFWVEEKEYHIANIRDISERKREEEILRKSEEKFRKLFENMTNSFALIKVFFDDKNNPVDYHYLDVNPVFEKISDLPGSALVSKSVRELYPDTEEYWFQLFGDVVKTGKPRHDVFYSVVLDRYIETYVYYTEKDNCAAIFNDVTDRKRNEDYLHKFKASIDNALDGIYWVNENGGFDYVNDQACKMLGYSRDKLLSLTVKDIDPIAAKRDFMTVWKDIFDNKSYTPNTIESLHKRKDGSLIPIELSTVLIRDGEKRLLISYVKDISDQKSYEESLLKNQKLLNDSQKAGNIGSWDYSIQRDELIMNEQACEIYGIDKATKLTREEHLTLVHPDDREIAENKFLESLETGVFPSFEFRIKLPNNTYRVVRSFGTIEFTEDKNPFRTYGIVQDITEQKKSEEDLLLFKTSIDQASDEVYWISENGRFDYVNEKVVEDLGYSREELLQMTIFDIDPDLEKQFWFEKWNAIKLAKTRNEKANIIETIHKRKDGSLFPVEVMNYYLRYKEKEYLIAYIRDITEQKHHQQALLKSQKLLLESQRIAEMGTWELDLATKEIFWGEEAYKIFDYNKETIANYESVKKIIYSEDLTIFEQHLQTTLKEGVFRDLKCRIVAGNGKIRWVIIAGEIIYDEKDIPVKFYGIIQDISEQKENEDQLIREKIRAEESEQRFKALHNASFGGITIHDGGVILDCNQGLSTITGYSIEELIGMDGLLLIAEEFRDTVRNKIREGNEKSYEVMGVRKNGEKYHLRLEARGIPYKGKPVRSVEFRDITKEKDAERQILAAKERAEESEYFLQESQRIGNIGSFNLNISRDNWISNEILDNILGIDKNYIKTIKSWEDLFYFEDTSTLKNKFEDLITKNSAVFDMEYRIVRHSDGKVRWVHGVGKPFFDKNSNLIQVLGTIQDITERKAYEQKINELNIELEKRVTDRTFQLQQANKDLEAFAYSVSHDLRAPIRHINGFLQLLKKELNPLPEKALSYYEKIDSSTAGMAVLIDELLKFSRLGRAELNYRNINLNGIIDEIIERFKPDYANRSLKFDVAKLPIVKGDPNLLKIVLENLLSNAIKYTSKKEDGLIQIKEYESDLLSITFIVKDNGAGFDENYKDNLFGVFKRLHTNSEFEGIGIGLANVKQILTKHGGSIDASSKVGEGATFYITLPKSK